MREIACFAFAWSWLVLLYIGMKTVEKAVWLLVPRLMMEKKINSTPTVRIDIFIFEEGRKLDSRVVRIETVLFYSLILFYFFRV